MKNTVKGFAFLLLLFTFFSQLSSGTVSASTDWDYTRNAVVRWQDDSSITSYPVYLGSVDFYRKVESDFDDVRVFVDGVSTDFWQVGFNASQSAQTRLWTNISFAPRQVNSLKNAIATTGTLSSVYLQDSISALPSSGYLMIDNEIIHFGSKNNTTSSVHFVTRGHMGSTAATHSANAPIEWIQHNIELAYGNSNATGITTNDDYMPPFELNDSDNEDWHYNFFGGDATDTHSLSYASWKVNAFSPACFSFPTGGNPWTEVGINYDGTPCGGGNAFYVLNDVGISNVYFHQGEAVIEEDWSQPYATTGIRSTDGSPTSNPYYWTNNHTFIASGDEGYYDFSSYNANIYPARRIAALYFYGWPGAWGWTRTEEATVTNVNYPSVSLTGEL